VGCIRAPWVCSVHSLATPMRRLHELHGGGSPQIVKCEWSASA